MSQLAARYDARPDPIAEYRRRLQEAVLARMERRIEQACLPRPHADARADFESTSRAVCAGREAREP